MIINLVDDPSVASAPEGFKAALTYAAGILESLFSNPITINIEVGFGEIEGAPLGADDVGEGGPTSLTGYSYSQVLTALTNAASSPADETAITSLPGSDPTDGGTIAIGGTEAKALGLIAGNGTAIDGAVGFSSTAGLFNYNTNNQTVAGEIDFVGVALHELTHAMGRISLLQEGLPDDYSVLDLFRYSSPGIHDLVGGQPAYFSIDGGVDNIENFATSSDLADWSSTAIDDAFADEVLDNSELPLSSSDIEEMNVLGYTLAHPVTGFEKVGVDQLVNTTTYYGQFDPAIARLNNGNVIIAWSDYGDHSLSAQLFSPNDSPIGDEQIVYEEAGPSEISPSIAALTGGGYVVTWISSAYGGFSATVDGQIYDGEGNPVGSEFSVSTLPGIDSHPTVTALADGGFIASWQNQGAINGTYVRVFDTGGTATGTEIDISGTLGAPASTMLSDGKLLLAYIDSTKDIEGQILNQDGSVAGASFQISGVADGTVGDPSVAALANGDIVVAWTASNSNPVLSGTVEAQVFSSSGAQIGSEFQVNSFAPAYYLNPSDGYGYAPSDVQVCSLADGRFVVTWTDWSETLGDTSNSAIHAQVFTANGVRTGQEFLINTQTAAGQTGAQVVALPDGSFIVAYEDDSQTGGDTSGGAVRSQIFNPLNYVMSAADATYYGGTMNDVVTQGKGDETLYGGGGTDTFVVPDFSASQVSVIVNAQGNVVLTDNQGDVDTLEGFSTISLADATININGDVLTEENADGSSSVSAFSFVSSVMSDGASLENVYVNGVLKESTIVANGNAAWGYSQIVNDFNAGGELTEQIVTLNNGATDDYLYSNGVETKETIESNGNTAAWGYSQIVDDYDASGVEIEQTGAYSNGATWDNQYTNGVLTLLTVVANGNAASWGVTQYVYSYNASGALTEQVFSSTNGATYDDLFNNGALTTATVDSMGNAFAWGWTECVNSYSASGAITGEFITSNSGATYDFLYNNGLETQETVVSNGEAAAWGFVQLTNDYNASGALTEQTGNFSNGASWDNLYTNGVVTTKTINSNSNAATWGYSATVSNLDSSGNLLATAIYNASQHISQIDIYSDLAVETYGGLQPGGTWVLDLQNDSGRQFSSAQSIVNALQPDGHGGSLLSFGANAGSIDFSGLAPGQIQASNFAIG